MARLSRWAVFWRAFFLTLVLGSSIRAQAIDPQEVIAWENAVAAGTPESYIGYLRIYPTGAFIEQAVEALIFLGVLDQTSPLQQSVQQPLQAATLY